VPIKKVNSFRDAEEDVMPQSLTAILATVKGMSLPAGVAYTAVAGHPMVAVVVGVAAFLYWFLKPHVVLVRQRSVELWAKKLGTTVPPAPVSSTAENGQTLTG
jgi:hypothetical protein